MLRNLSANYDEFKSFDFRPGMNIIVAERTSASQSTDSRNGTGKTSLTEVLHYLLGANTRGHLCSKEVFRSKTFTLVLDWSTPGGTLEVSRRGGESRVRTDPLLDYAPWEGINLDEWKTALQKQLYPQSGAVNGIHVRTLLSYAIRREKDGGFHDPLKFSTSPTKKSVFSTHLAYLLGLDAQLIDQYRVLAEKKSSADALKKGLEGLDLGEVVGSQARLESRARLLEHEIEQLREQITRFQVEPEFEALKTRGDEITTKIEHLARQDDVDSRNLADIHDSLERERHPSDDYLSTAFAELGVTLPHEVRRRFNEVERFHRVIAENRQRFLHDELRETEARLKRRRDERRRLDDERAVIMRRLDQGGALQALQMLQHSLASKEARLESLKEQTDLLEKVRNMHDDVRRELMDLRDRVHDDLRTRADYITDASNMFTDFARRIYASDREAFLTIKEGDKNLVIDPHIENQASNGIGNMRMLCFDLVCAVMAHRGRRGPDFLVHDGRLYDGVDERQVASGMRLAAEVAEAEGMQYIVPINSDVLAKARDCGFDPEPYVLEPVLTDADERGGLFGFRFD